MTLNWHLASKHRGGERVKAQMNASHMSARRKKLATDIKGHTLALKINSFRCSHLTQRQSGEQLQLMLFMCASDKDPSVSSADKCHQWCHYYLRGIFKTDHLKTACIKGAFSFPKHTHVHMCVEGGPCQISDTNEWPAHTKAHIKLGFSVTALLFGRDLSTANSASEHIHVIPQPPKRVPVERVKTRGFIRSQAVPFGKNKSKFIWIGWRPPAGRGTAVDWHLHINTTTWKNWKNGSIQVWSPAKRVS